MKEPDTMKATQLIRFISILLLVTLFGCLDDERLKTSFNIDAIDVGDGWEISTPTAEGFNDARFRSAIGPFFAEDRFVTAISLIVVRNNKLVAEAYVQNLNDRYQKRQIQSTTKCITSLVFGIARDMNYFSNLDQKLYDIVPNAFDNDGRKRGITLRHLLTMNSGLDFNNEDFAHELFMEKQKDVMKVILAKPLFALPGQVYDYRDCDPQLLSGAIHAQTGMTLDEVAGKKLFGPMGIADYYWERNEDGDSWASEALFMRPRDMAKIGQLVLNKGKWNGKQLVSQEWIEQCTSTQSDPNAGQPDDMRFSFGFYWRIQPNHVAFEANGAGGQQILIIPDKALVLVFTCEPYVKGKYSLASENYGIAQAIVNSIVH
jgi:CubicO group peptidase (beta-lactamase class C family)